MDDQLIDPVYLPFSVEQLERHFAPSGSGSSDEQATRYSKYYLDSAERYHNFQAGHPDRRGLPLSELRTPCQIEKDERFWVVACLMRYFYSADRTEHLSALMRLRFGDTPPLTDVASWNECLDGKLHLFFEVNLPSPPGYRRWLAEHLDQQQIVPYVLDAGRRRGTDEVRTGLEGSTHVDAVLLNVDNGFTVLFEAKVLSDVSCQISFDTMRNQIARNIDVMLERNDGLPKPLSQRRPERTLFVLLTPEVFRQQPHSRLYGWLMNEYCDDATALARDIPHRQSVDWSAVACRIGWLTWEDCERVLPGACPWLTQKEIPEVSPNSLSESKSTRKIKLNTTMLYKYCPCGHPVGVEMATNAPPFYDNFDWDKPIDTCPSCHKLIKASELDFNEEQLDCLQEVCRMLLKWANEGKELTT